MILIQSLVFKTGVLVETTTRLTEQDYCSASQIGGTRTDAQYYASLPIAPLHLGDLVSSYHSNHSFKLTIISPCHFAISAALP